MSEVIKIGAVSYLNTKPLTYGIAHTNFSQKIELTFEYPAIIAEQLSSKKIHLGLVPVAAISQIPDARIISEFCIGAVGKVNSVCLFSEVPISEIKEVYLDYQSRTSVRLAQVLMKDYWKHSVQYLQADTNYISKIAGTTAGVIIGDRALELLDVFPYVYDLSEYWQKLYGLPFVFAAWVANRDLPASFIEKFNEANKIGLDNLDIIIAENNIDFYDLKKYYTEDISYILDDTKKKALQLFLDTLNQDRECQNCF